MLRKNSRMGAIAAVLLLAALLLTVTIALRRAEPILKARIVETLTSRFQSRVELDTLHVSVLRGVEASGEGLRIFPPSDVMAAGATQPLIAVAKFSFHSGVFGIFFKPIHVGVVHVSGLEINIPPREMRERNVTQSQRPKGPLGIVVDTIVCEKSRLIVGTAKIDKDPKDFELSRIELHNVGPDDSWSYDATLINAIPRGDIHATGNFGPWQTASPGDSFVQGHYTFDRADLNTIKGIGGILSSQGEFTGRLNRIDVTGTTDTPDFSLDSGNHPMRLRTKFHAVVDGTSGDTYLQPVDAKLRGSSFTASGAVINMKGKGHMIDLDVNVRSCEIRDFLDLAVKTSPAVMSGDITAKVKLHIRPGKESVSQKLDLAGDFSLRRIQFTNPQLQDKVDMLSLRARGDPKDAKPGAPDVKSEMTGAFKMRDGRLDFSRIVYDMPGAGVNLAGVYSLNGDRFDFEGKVRTDATISQMVASRWKSLLLKPVSPFFKKNGAGAEIPVKITGTRSEPKFGLAR